MKGSKANHVDRYTKLIMEGGVNKCIICNRCLYARSVPRFHGQSSLLFYATGAYL